MFSYHPGHQTQEERRVMGSIHHVEYCHHKELINIFVYTTNSWIFFLFIYKLNLVGIWWLFLAPQVHWHIWFQSWTHIFRKPKKSEDIFNEHTFLNMSEGCSQDRSGSFDMRVIITINVIVFKNSEPCMFFGHFMQSRNTLNQYPNNYYPNMYL